MITIYSKDGKPIARSKNLRGIMDRARKLSATGKYPYGTMLSKKGRGNRILRALFPDASYCYTMFGDPAVLQLWIEDRVKYGRGKFEEYVV